MVYLWGAWNLPNPFAKVLPWLALSPLFRVVSQKIVLNSSVKHCYFLYIYRNIHIIRHEPHSYQGSWKFSKPKGVHMSQWECIPMDVQLAWLYNVWVATHELKYVVAWNVEWMNDEVMFCNKGMRCFEIKLEYHIPEVLSHFCWLLWLFSWVLTKCGWQH